MKKYLRVNFECMVRLQGQGCNTRFTPSLKFYTFNLSQSVKIFILVGAKRDRCKVLYFCVILIR